MFEFKKKVAKMNTKSPLISILMPVKNTAQFLPVSIKSIINQTEKNWELIAVNDNSSDNSYQVLCKFAEEDDRIKVFNNENGQGIIPALKTALNKSCGKYVTRMDSDDIMTDYKLEKMKVILDKYGKGTVATGPVKCFCEEGIGDGYRKYEQWLNDLIIAEKCYSEIYKECVIQSSCWMVDRDDLIACNSFETEVYPEDYDLSFRFYQRGIQVKSYPHLLHYWRDYPGRTSRNDPRYKDQQYFDLKLKYFFELEYDQERTLVVWGTGRKGKKLVRKLQDYLQKKEMKCDFRWVGNNSKKIGEKIYGVSVENCNIVRDLNNPQIIVAVSSPPAIQEIKETFSKWEFEQNDHFYFFC